MAPLAFLLLTAAGAGLEQTDRVLGRVLNMDLTGVCLMSNVFEFWHSPSGSAKGKSWGGMWRCMWLLWTLAAVSLGRIWSAGAPQPLLLLTLISIPLLVATTLYCPSVEYIGWTWQWADIYFQATFIMMTRSFD